MKLLRPLRWLILAISCFAILSFGVAEETAGWATLLLLLAITGWYITEGKLGTSLDAADRAQLESFTSPAPQTSAMPLQAGLPRLAVNIVLVAAIPWAIWRAKVGESPISAFLTLLAVVLVLKLWEKRDRSDYGQILTMAVFLTIGSTLNNSSFLIGLCLVLQMPLVLLGAMMLHTLTPALIERSTLRAQPPTTAQAPRPFAAKASRSPLAPTLIMALCVMLAALPIIIAIFIITPRSNIQGVLSSFGVARRTSGLADSVTLNTGGLISQSREVIARVSLSDNAGRVLGGTDIPQYLRAIVMLRSVDGNWYPGSRMNEVPGTTLNPSPDRFTILFGGMAEVDASRRIRQRITPLAGSYGPLFALARPVAIKLDESLVISHSQKTGELAISTARGPIAYDVISVDGLTIRPERTQRGNVSYDEPEVATIAGQVLRTAGIEPDVSLRAPEHDALAVRAMETYLQSNFTYSLDTPTPATRNVVTWFLKTKPPAHCEFFASALAAMCRSVGIDARVIAGYMTSEFDEASNQYTVRSSDAHAWVEAETAPGRWQTFDGTPLASEAFMATRQGNAFDTFVRWLRSAEGVWNSSFVSFDQRKQSQMWGGSEWVRNLQPQAQIGADITQWRQRMRTTSIWAMRIALGATAIAGIVFGISRLLRVWLPQRALAGFDTAFDDDPPARALYAQVLATCQALGEVKPAPIPLQQHVRSRPALARHASLLASVDALYIRGFAARAKADRADDAAFASRAKLMQAQLRTIAKQAPRSKS